MGFLTLALAATAATTALTVNAQQQAGAAQRAELQVQKREEAAGARDREVLRKRRITAILGAQAADAAAKGVALSGSVGNISLVDAKRSAEEGLIDDVNTKSRIAALSRRSRSIRRLTNLKSGITILGAGSSIAGRGSTSGGSGSSSGNATLGAGGPEV